jgi:hypothetical protein
MTPAQARVLARLDTGETVCAYTGVSRATAFALVRLGLAEWAVEPHMSGGTRLNGRIRPQLEWGIRARTICWDLDGTVAERARLGRYMAELWYTCDGDEGGWAVFELRRPDKVRYPVAEGKASTYEAAKEQAEAALRRLNQPASIPSGNETGD